MSIWLHVGISVDIDGDDGRCAYYLLYASPWPFEAGACSFCSFPAQETEAGRMQITYPGHKTSQKRSQDTTNEQMNEQTHYPVLAQSPRLDNCCLCAN